MSFQYRRPFTIKRRGFLTIRKLGCLPFQSAAQPAPLVLRNRRPSTSKTSAEVEISGSPREKPRQALRAFSKLFPTTCTGGWEKSGNSTSAYGVPIAGSPTGKPREKRRQLLVLLPDFSQPPVHELGAAVASNKERATKGRSRARSEPTFALDRGRNTYTYRLSSAGYTTSLVSLQGIVRS